MPVRKDELEVAMIFVLQGSRSAGVDEEDAELFAKP